MEIYSKQELDMPKTYTAEIKSSGQQRPWWAILKGLKHDAKVRFYCSDCGRSYCFYIGVDDPRGKEENCCIYCLSDNVEIKSIRKIDPSAMEKCNKKMKKDLGIKK